MTPRRGPPCLLLRLLPSGCLVSLAPNEVKEGRGEGGGMEKGEGGGGVLSLAAGNARSGFQ